MYPRNFDLWNSILMSPDGEGDGAAAVETPAASEPAPSGAEDFSGLDFGGDDIDEVIVGEPDAGTDLPETQPEPKPQEAKPAVETPAPSQKTEEVAAKPPGQQEQTPPPTPTEPEDLWGKFQKDKPAIIDHMAKNRYGFSKEEQDLLEAEPFTALPRMAARLHVEVVQDVLQSIAGMLPVAFQGMLQDHNVNTQTESEFKAAWPQIDFAKHGNDVETFAKIYRQSNPKATKDEAIRMVGAMVVAKHGLAAAPPPATVPVPSQVPAPQQAPSFRPAQPGTVHAPAPVVVEEFAGLGMDFSDE